MTRWRRYGTCFTIAVPGDRYIHLNSPNSFPDQLTLSETCFTIHNKRERLIDYAARHSNRRHARQPDEAAIAHFISDKVPNQDDKERVNKFSKNGIGSSYNVQVDVSKESRK
jgi:hypothetical protein